MGTPEKMLKEILAIQLSVLRIFKMGYLHEACYGVQINVRRKSRKIRKAEISSVATSLPQGMRKEEGGAKSSYNQARRPSSEGLAL